MTRLDLLGAVDFRRNLQGGRSAKADANDTTQIGPWASLAAEKARWVIGFDELGLRDSVLLGRVWVEGLGFSSVC